MKPREIFRKVERKKRNVLTLEEAKSVLEYYKIPMAKSELVKSTEEAIEVADRIGYPVVLKVVSPSIVHKTDVGGLILNIKNKSEVQIAYRRIINNIRRCIPGAKIDGMLVQEMVEDGQELIIGGKRDEQFGQVILFGFGGIFTEVYDDTSLRVVPITKKDAEEMIKEIKGYEILKGYRGKVYDTNALVEILLKTSKLLEENQKIKELDINPVIVLQRGAVAVDARIVVD